MSASASGRPIKSRPVPMRVSEKRKSLLVAKRSSMPPNQKMAPVSHDGRRLASARIIPTAKSAR